MRSFRFLKSCNSIETSAQSAHELSPLISSALHLHALNRYGPGAGRLPPPVVILHALRRVPTLVMIIIIKWHATHDDDHWWSCMWMVIDQASKTCNYIEG